MAGLFGFLSGQSSDTQVYRDEVKDETPKTAEGSGGLTGVAKYLQAQKPAPAATGVAKYLKNKEQHVPSGVAKYLARKSVAEKLQAPSDADSGTVTGVDKYLQSQEDRPRAVRSGVEKYLANRKSTALSGVSKYLANKKVAAKNAPVSPKVTGVAKYLDTRKVTLTTGVGKYVAKQTLAAKQLAAETAAAAAEAVVIAEPATGVEKYLRAKG